MSGRRACPVCGAPAGAPLVSIPRLPVFANQLCRTRDAALAAATASFELCLCEGCGHAYNALFDAARMDYGPEYESSLHFSPTFQEYARELSERIRARYGLREKQIVEIGCGRGDFLHLLCRGDRNRGLGFDPSYVSSGEPRDSSVTIFAEACTAASLRGVRPDFVCCRHVLEHVPDPVAFLRVIRHACGCPQGTPVFFEVPNALFTLEEGGIWDLIYEHASYFTPSSLRRAFLEAGFAVESVEPAFEGQFLTIHARAYDDGAVDAESARGAAYELSSSGASFAERFRRTIESWTEHLDACRLRGAAVAIWGAGSKGTTFLNLVSASDAIFAVVDVNPRKQGAFVPGTGHSIVSPRELARFSPELVIVMNAAYEREIAAELATLGLSPTLRSTASPPAARAA